MPLVPKAVLIQHTFISHHILILITAVKLFYFTFLTLYTLKNNEREARANFSTHQKEERM